MNHDAFMMLGGVLLSLMAFLLVHLWRCMVIEERFEKRFQDAADYWQAENNKLLDVRCEREMQYYCNIEKDDGGWHCSRCFTEDLQSEAKQLVLLCEMGYKPVMGQMMRGGVGLIQDERQRQLTEEEFLPSHDQQYTKQELIRAAQSYLMAAEFIEQFPKKKTDNMIEPSWWPWDSKWWKPSSDPIRNLQKAGALIAAEIDRLQASAATSERKDN